MGREANTSHRVQSMHNVTHINAGHYVTQSQHKETFKKNHKDDSRSFERQCQSWDFLIKFYAGASPSNLLNQPSLDTSFCPQSFTVMLKIDNAHTAFLSPTFSLSPFPPPNICTCARAHTPTDSTYPTALPIQSIPSLLVYHTHSP